MGRIVELRKQGKSIREIAEELNVSKSSIHRLLSQDDKVNNVPTTIVPEKKKQFYTREEIYEIPIVKLFKWELTPAEEEEVMSTGRLDMYGYSALRNEIE